MKYIIGLLALLFCHVGVFGAGSYYYVTLSFFGSLEVADTEITLQNGFKAKFNHKDHSLEVPFDEDANNPIIIKFTAPDGVDYSSSLSSQDIKESLNSSKSKVLYTQPPLVDEDFYKVVNR